jgi:hypothetical protein
MFTNVRFKGNLRKCNTGVLQRAILGVTEPGNQGYADGKPDFLRRNLSSMR